VQQESSVDWDVFVSHASEDKEEFARPLAQALQDHGLRVWFDEFTLRVGDSLRRSIDRGLSRSRYGVVVISPAFLEKEWPQKELDGLVAQEVDGRKVILPVWHRIDASLLRRHSPTLADRLATSSGKGLGKVVADLLDAMGRAPGTGKPGTAPFALAKPPLSIAERLVLDVLRGKPDVRWSSDLITVSLHEKRSITAPPASEIQKAILSLLESGYLVIDSSKTISVTDKAVQYYRAHGRMDPREMK